ncbi:MAG: CPBP family intramembrane glutamic endopeptidase [Bacillota bacterium]|nr:CPBP family intramembrane glutamic endopeptidase [Bacillota bacterium]
MLKFTLLFTAGSVVSYLLTLLTDSFQAFAYPLAAPNIIGHLGFQLFLSGPSEELIFRAFSMTLLSLMIRKRMMNGKVSYANLIAAVIFGMAHMCFSFSPFSVQFGSFQVILSIVLGIFYGDCYEKTKSMYYPMLMHSISNIVTVSISILGTYVTSK